jgi:DNA-binding NtrC family response regulator
MREGKILVVDDNKAVITALKLLLPIYFLETDTLTSTATLVRSVTTSRYDVVLLDMNFTAGVNSGNEGLYWLTEIKKYSPFSEVVLFTAYADVDLAVEAIKRGAFDFVVKPFENAKLITTLMAAYKLSVSNREVRNLKEIKREIKGSGEIFWGESPKMDEVRKLINKVAATDATILITGENGTGKDVLASEIHRRSARSEESMVRVDVGSLPETLFESELFGHVKGAFTDAKSDRAGKFEVAGGGTLFLDEIGNIPVHLQSKLLTVLQNRAITRIGSNTTHTVDIRLICATNKNMYEMVARGFFREDLLYRINTIHIHIPPLRERREDIVPFALLFLEIYSAKYSKKITGISEKAKDKLRSYIWKGNVRELQHSVEKAVILSESSILDTDDFLLAKNDEVDASDLSAVKTLDEMERVMIMRSLDTHGGNLSLVAAGLGITRQTLYNKIKRYGI